MLAEPPKLSKKQANLLEQGKKIKNNKRDKGFQDRPEGRKVSALIGNSLGTAGVREASEPRRGEHNAWRRVKPNGGIHHRDHGQWRHGQEAAWMPPPAVRLEQGVGSGCRCVDQGEDLGLVSILL